MIKQARVNFEELAQKRNDRRIAPRGIQMVGGEITITELLDWLQEWHKLDLQWRLWEEVSTIVLEERTMLTDVTYLERGRLFGAAGDLSLRRDGEQIYWWFVGDPTVTLPANHGGVSFWDDEAHLTQSFYIVEQQAILWGAFQGDDHPYWYDDRVGYANLAYPLSLHGNRHIYAQYREYVDGGRVAAIWMYALNGEKENKTNGNG